MRLVEVTGRMVRSWVRTPASLRAVFESSRRDAARTFLVSGAGRWSFAEHRDAVEALARYLHGDLGVAKGDRVAIAMRNWPEWSVAFWAATAIGAVAVPLNAWWSRPELLYSLDDCAASVAIVDQERYDRLAPALPGSLLKVLVVRTEGDLDGPAEHLDFAALIAAGAGALPPVEVGPDDLATIFYTSGTTGRPKGVAGTHLNICTNLLSRAFWRTCHAVRDGRDIPDPSGAVTLLTVPLFHVTGCHSYLYPALAQGFQLILMDRWDPREALRLITREGVTAVGGVPTTVAQLLDAYDPSSHDLSTLTAITVGGAPNPPALFERIRQRLPEVVLGNGYGMTETSSVATYNFGPDCVERPEAVGRLVPVMDSRVVDPRGNDVAEGGEGELWLRGPNVVPGYWTDGRVTPLPPGGDWLHTGDLVVTDPEGRLTLVGRSKEIIVRGGENISPTEIEVALYSHDSVAEAGVRGQPHPQLGEEPVAFVVLRQGATAGEADLLSHLRGRLAHFKVPVRIHIVEGPLPRSPQGKLKRSDL
jgi:acyl-CoA synthetase (AMP-forming)/AMP-acid ligase II